MTTNLRVSLISAVLLLNFIEIKMTQWITNNSLNVGISCREKNIGKKIQKKFTQIHVHLTSVIVFEPLQDFVI